MTAKKRGWSARYTAEEDAYIRLRGPGNVVADALGRSRASVKRRHRQLCPAPTAAPPIKCLRCRREFASEGKHNRVCDPCKNTVSWGTGGDYSVALP